MTRILVIDDMRVFEPLPDEEIVTHRNIFDATHPLFNEHWDEVWLDHDLGYDARGYRLDIRPLVLAVEEFAYIEGTILDVGVFVMITDNDPGRRWMIAALSPYYPIEVGKREYTIDWEATPG